MKITITTTAAEIPLPDYPSRLIGKNTGDEVIYFGFESSLTGADTADQGVPIDPDGVISVDLLMENALKPRLVTASGTSTFNYTVQ